MSNLSDYLKSGAAGVVSVADATAINIDVDENVSLTNNLTVAGSIVEQGGVLKQNLLTNSGFEIWSNSTVQNLHNLPDSTTEVSGTTCTSTAHDLVAGKLVADGVGDVFAVVSITNDDVFEVHATGADSGSQWKEMQPGCIAANTLGPDGWSKTPTLDLWRQHEDTTYTKDGSFYSVKAQKGVDTGENLKWLTVANNKEHLARFRGRTVTIGCWVYSVSASDNVRLRMYYGTGNAWSSYAGADAWEWLEVTYTLSDDPAVTSQFSFWIDFGGDALDIAYISQPMLVFGSSIGEGNYTRPQGEVIIFEENIRSAKLDNTDNHSDESKTALNIEADTNGKIGKGAAAFYIRTGINDVASAAATSTGGLYLFGHASVNDVRHYCAGLGNNARSSMSSWVSANVSGDIEYQIDATSNNALDIWNFLYQQIKLK